MNETPQYLTERQVAELTGLSLSKLRNDRFLRRGIPWCKASRTVRYLKSDVIEFFESRKIIPTDS